MNQKTHITMATRVLHLLNADEILEIGLSIFQSSLIESTAACHDTSLKRFHSLYGSNRVIDVSSNLD